MKGSGIDGQTNAGVVLPVIRELELRAIGEQRLRIAEEALDDVRVLDAERARDVDNIGQSQLRGQEILYPRTTCPRRACKTMTALKSARRDRRSESRISVH